MRLSGIQSMLSSVCLSVCVDDSSSDEIEWHSVDAVAAVQRSFNSVGAVCSGVWLASILSTCQQLVSSTLYLKEQHRRCTSTDFGNFWQRCRWESILSNGDLLFHLSYRMSLHYLGKHEPRKLSFQWWWQTGYSPRPLM